MLMFKHFTGATVLISILLLQPVFVPEAMGEKMKDIRKLSQHFIDTTGDTSPWRFIPEDNIASISTSEHPGMLKIKEAGKGTDIKGILEEPINLAEYPPPWEFQMGLIQRVNMSKGSEEQANYAFGLNLVVTFSDPSTWPEDRTQRPPDTHELQLLVVHLGNFGENYRIGVPQVKHTPLNFYDPAPEVYMLYGRGDLAPSVNGNWNVPYVWVGIDEGTSAGSWRKLGGPASHDLRFRVSLTSRENISVGMGFSHHAGHRHRNFNTSEFGQITGIWEIGPIVSLDNWIPDVLAKELDLDGPPEWVPTLKSRSKTVWAEYGEDTLKPLDEIFGLRAPDPKFPCYVDYAMFFANGPDTIEQFSEDFNIPGFLADFKYYIEGNAFQETLSNPGYLTVTQYGDNAGWAMSPIARGWPKYAIDLSEKYHPPFEMEIAFISPSNDKPWNLWQNFGLRYEDDTYHGWQPGIKNIPGEGCKFFNTWANDPMVAGENTNVNLVFDPEIPEILASKPLYWVLQVMDNERVRVGFRTSPDEPWTFSKIFNSMETHEKKIAQLGYPALVSYQGDGSTAGWGIGNYPNYQQIKIDYWHYRYSLSDNE